MGNNDNKDFLTYEGKDIILVGTAHVSLDSAELVARVIQEEKPDTVCVELCESRFQALTQKKRWQEMDIVKVIREKKAFLLFLNLLLASFQKRVGDKLGIQPGAEMMRAIEVSEATGARIHLADRDIRITLSRTWRLMGLWSKVKLLSQTILSLDETARISQEDIEKMKREDVLETVLSEVGESLPEVRRILIDERDQYLTSKIRSAPGQRIVAVVGAGHVPGIRKYWNEPIDLEPLEQLPPKSRTFQVLKWGIPFAIVALVALGFFRAGAEAGTQMIKWWILANAVLAGLGAAAALPHPLTILAAAAAAPLTSLNPMVAAGWVAGLVETILGKPRVRDFESLSNDISTVKGFWRNKITRILLVVVLTNLGSSIGTFVAIPLMLKVLT
jgi:pheromone shutdown-related protein TraB